MSKLLSTINADNSIVVKHAVKHMTAALREEYYAIRKEAENLTKADLITKHRIGCRVNSILEDTNRYGEQAVKKLATALNVSRDYLYKLKHVAIVWTEEELTDIIRRSAEDPNLMPITYSHLEVLASIPRKSHREKLLKTTMMAWLTVQQLIDAVREDLGVRRSNTGPRLPKTTSAALNKLDVISKKLAEYAPVLHKAVSENFSEKEISQKLLERIDETLAEQRQLAQTIKIVCNDLESLKDRAIRLSSEMGRKTAKHILDHTDDYEDDYEDDYGDEAEEVLEGEIIEDDDTEEVFYDEVDDDCEPIMR